MEHAASAQTPTGWSGIALKPLGIGEHLTVAFPVMLAPMAGYTDAAMRGLCRRMGCGLVFTEVVNAEGVVRGSRRTLHLLETAPGERPVAAHLYGREPGVLAAASARVALLGRFDLIDINCGCPVRRIVAKGAGVALMKEPDRIGRIVRAVREAVSLPVTVKTRLGLAPGQASISDVAQAVEEAGGAAIFIHARFAHGRHSGRHDWELLARIKAERHIPVVGNGGVFAAPDVAAMFRQTGVDGVMIGRAAVGNPWIFSEAAALLRGEPCPAHSLAEHRAVVAEHLAGLIALKEADRRYRGAGSLSAERAAVMHFRSHLLKYVAGFRGAAAVRRSLQRMGSVEDVRRAMDGVIAAEQAAADTTAAR